MRLTSIGSQRDRKTIQHISEKDLVHKLRGLSSTSAFVTDGKPQVRVSIYGNRRYTLILHPDEVLSLLATLPPDSLADAVKTVSAKDPGLAKKLPEAIKQIVIGFAD